MNKPNILLLIMDSVRAKNTSLHSYKRDTTPFLSDFADKSNFYEQARAPSPHSLSSHTSMFTGLHVPEHNHISTDMRLRPGTTVFHALREFANYETGVFSQNPFLTELDVGLKSAFDNVYSGTELLFDSALDPTNYITDDGIQYGKFILESFKKRSPFRSVLNGISKLNSRPTAENYVDEFLNWKDSITGPWAGVINLMDAHIPYLPHSEYLNWGSDNCISLMRKIDDPQWEFQCGVRPWSEMSALEDLYDDCIRYMDTQISRLIRCMRDENELDNTIIIITSDHGEGFGEQSRIRPSTRLAGHGEAKIHEAVLHVPLLIRYPGQNSNEHIKKPVSLTALSKIFEKVAQNKDYSNTDLLSTPVLSTAPGLQMDEADSKETIAGIKCNQIDCFNNPSKAIFDFKDGHIIKHIQWKTENVNFKLADGPNFEKIKGTSRNDLFDEYFGKLQNASVITDKNSKIDDEVYSRLQDLGYA